MQGKALDSGVCYYKLFRHIATFSDGVCETKKLSAQCAGVIYQKIAPVSIDGGVVNFIYTGSSLFKIEEFKWRGLLDRLSRNTSNSQMNFLYRLYDSFPSPARVIEHRLRNLLVWDSRYEVKITKTREDTDPKGTSITCLAELLLRVLEQKGIDDVAAMDRSKTQIANMRNETVRGSSYIGKWDDYLEIVGMFKLNVEFQHSGKVKDGAPATPVEVYAPRAGAYERIKERASIIGYSILVTNGLPKVHKADVLLAMGNKAPPPMVAGQPPAGGSSASLRTPEQIVATEQQSSQKRTREDAQNKTADCETGDEDSSKRPCTGLRLQNPIVIID
jgi:hypothetical protein